MVGRKAGFLNSAGVRQSSAARKTDWEVRAGEKIRFVLFRVSYDPGQGKGQNTNSEGPSINHAAITGTGRRRRWWPRRAFCELEMFPSIVGRPTFPPFFLGTTQRDPRRMYEVAKCTHYPPPARPRPLPHTIILSPLPTFPFPSESSLLSLRTSTLHSIFSSSIRRGWPAEL